MDDGWMDGQRGGYMYVWMDGWIEGWIDDVWTYGYVDRWKNEWLQYLEVPESCHIMPRTTPYHHTQCVPFPGRGQRLMTGRSSHETFEVSGTAVCDSLLSAEDPRPASWPMARSWRGDCRLGSDSGCTPASLKGLV